MTMYRILIESAGNMHQQKEPGGLGWNARETSFDHDFDDFSSIVLLENQKVFLTKELIISVGKGHVPKGQRIHLEHHRYLYELPIEDLEIWKSLNSGQPRGQRDKEVKDRNLGVIEFLKNLLMLKGEVVES